MDEGNQQYLENCHQFNQADKNFEEIEEIEDFFINHLVACVKYNYTLKENSPVGCYDAILQYNRERNELVINKKIIIEEIIDSVKQENENLIVEDL